VPVGVGVGVFEVSVIGADAAPKKRVRGQPSTAMDGRGTSPRYGQQLQHGRQYSDGDDSLLVSSSSHPRVHHTHANTSRIITLLCMCRTHTTFFVHISPTTVTS
jgi:hypothetical protein